MSCIPDGAVVNNLPASAGDARDAGLMSGLERFPEVGNGNPLQYSCLENSMDRGACWTKELDTTEQQSTANGTSVQFSCSVMSVSL